MSRPTEAPGVLLDVDVVLDVLAGREPFARDSSALLAACEAGVCRGFVAAHTVTTLAYLLRRYRGEASARSALAALLKIVQVAAVDAKTIENALISGFPDFEDAVQMSAAEAVRADYIATRNLKHFSLGPIQALAPAELLPLILPQE